MNAHSGLYQHMIQSGYFSNTRFIMALLNHYPMGTSSRIPRVTLKDVQSMPESELLALCVDCLLLKSRFKHEHAAHIYQELHDWLFHGLRMAPRRIDAFFATLPRSSDIFH